MISLYMGGMGMSVDAACTHCTSIYSLRERLCTHKVFTKDQCFYHKFSIKSYVLDVY